MTDRIRKATVIFDRDIREDDAEQILSALRMVKYVAEVIPGEPVNHEHRREREIGCRQLVEVLYGVLRLQGWLGDQDKYKRLCELIGVKPQIE